MTTFVLQLSDLHVFAEPEQAVRGVPTRKSLIEVLEKVRDTGLSFDRVIVSGDLTHDERPEAYRAVRELLEEWLDRCHVIPGNHDDRALLREVLVDQTDGSDDGIRFSVATGGWRLIGIDTHVPGEVSGRVAPAMLEWLESELERHPGEPTILFAHHPPIPVGSAWLDGLGLLDPEPLRELICRSRQVRVVSCGHVHQEFCGRLGEAVVMTVPSTGVQFIPLEATSRVDAIAPGFRVFALENFDTAGDATVEQDPAWTSRVVRLAGVTYPAVDE